MIDLIVKVKRIFTNGKYCNRIRSERRRRSICRMVTFGLDKKLTPHCELFMVDLTWEKVFKHERTRRLNRCSKCLKAEKDTPNYLVVR